MRVNPASAARRLATLGTAAGLAIALAAGGAFLPASWLQVVAPASAQDDEEWGDDAEDEGSEEEAYEEDESEEDGSEDEEYAEDGGEEDGSEDEEYAEDGADEDGSEDEEYAEDGSEEDGSEEDGSEEDGSEDEEYAEDGAGEDGSEDEEYAEDESGEEGAEDEAYAEDGSEEDGAEDWSDDEYADELDAEPYNDFEDDSWAGAYEDDESAGQDDAIPVDDETWGEDIEWEVTEVIEYEEASDAGDGGDVVGVGEMLSLRKSPRKASAGGQGGRRPPAGSKDDDEDTPYAFGGRPVSALAVPWQAQIFNPKVRPDPANPKPVWQRAHYCGGALIAPDWVLTAAHCIDQELVDYGFKVRLGVSDIAKGDGVTYRIERIVRHSQYNADNNDPARPPNMYANDIALIRIAPDGPAQARDPKKIRTIPINRKPLAGGTPVSATGWGAVGTGDTQAASAAILRVDLRLMDTPVCQQRPTYGAQKIHGNVFCASHPTRSTCRGDSGGPVVLTNGTPTLVGLVSWGKKKCAGDGRPGVYTRIDRYAGWIEQAMKLPPGRNALP